MSLGQTILFLVVLFLANTVEAITGFAGTPLAMPPSILLIGVDEAKVILNLMNLILSPLIVIQGYKYLEGKALGQIILFMCIGMVAGMAIYNAVSATILIPLYGLFVIAIGVSGFMKKGQSDSLPKWKQYGTLLGAGVMHGLFISGGPLLVIYAMMRFRDKDSFRVNLSAIWIILSVALAVKDYAAGLITTDMVWLTAWSVIPLVGAVIVGNWLHHRISQQWFLRITYVLLIIVGLSLIV